MPMSDSLNAVNSSVRTVIALALLGGLGYGGWQAYSAYDQQRSDSDRTNEQMKALEVRLESTAGELAAAKRTLAEQAADIEAKEREIAEKVAEIDRLDTSIKLLKVDHRIARLTVLDQSEDEESGTLTTLVRFQELTPQGDPAGDAKEFEVIGDVVYIDNWVVKFDDEFVENADIDRSTSLVLFRRIFGEYQEPRHGHMLDQVGAQPHIYARGGRPSEFEQKIWKDFWLIANDEERANELGIRAAHGEAVSIKVEEGKSYRINLRASDGLSIRPEN